MRSETLCSSSTNGAIMRKLGAAGRAPAEPEEHALLALLAVLRSSGRDAERAVGEAVGDAQFTSPQPQSWTQERAAGVRKSADR